MVVRNKPIDLCDPYVWEDPRYLFRFHRPAGVCVSDNVNFIVLVYILAVLLGFTASALTKRSGLTLLAGLLATLFLIPTFLKLRRVEQFRTQFVGSKYVAEDSDDPDKLYEQSKKGLPADEGFVASQPIPDFNQTGVVGNPANPFNNVLLNEIKYTPTRPAAPDATTTGARIALDDFFRVQWYSDPTDVFGKSQSQRQFVTQPVTTIPNDQGSYQDWLYKIPGKTCKEGNAAACYGGTNGAALPWLNL
jgi:hypothetical protein